MIDVRRHPVFNSCDLPKNIKDGLEAYYANADHPPIGNNSFSRYPYLFDFEQQQHLPIEERKHWINDYTDVDRFLLMNGAQESDGYCLIYWDW